MIRIFGLMFAFALMAGEQHRQYSPTVAEYESKVEQSKKMAIGVFSHKTWEKIILKRKSDGVETAWSDLDQHDKDVFCFVVGNRTLSSLMKLEEFWVEELKKFESPNHKLVGSSDSRPAVRSEVNGYLDSVVSTRKSFAAEFETFGRYFFARYADELTREDIMSYNNKISNSK